MTNSGKADAQNGQNATHQDANFTQEKAVDSTIALIKPSELSDPSANFDRNNDGGCQGRTSTN